MKCTNCKNYLCCDTEVFNLGYEENKAEECPIFKETGYADTMNNIVDYLKNERDRRLHAIDTNMFCDNEVSKRHCIIIDSALRAIKLTARQLRDEEAMLNELDRIEG